MQTYFLKFVFIIFLFFAAYSAKAQLPIDAQLYDKIEYTLSALDKSEITSQTFFDQSMGFQDWNKLNGTISSSSNTLKASSYEWLRIQLESSFINGYDPLPPSSSYMEFYSPNYNNPTVPLSIIHWEYQKFIDDPVGDGLITIDYQEEKFYDVPDRTESPYEDCTLVAICPVTNKSLVGLSQTFMLYEDLLLTNQNQAVSIKVDFGDGQGFVQIFEDIETVVQYSSPGSKTLTLEYDMGNSEVFYAQCSITIEATPPANLQTNVTRQGTDCGPGYTVDANGADENRTDISPGIIVNIAYNCFDANGDGKMLKPFIIIEGFDPPSLGKPNTYPAMYSRLDLLRANPLFNAANGNPVVLPNNRSLREELYCQGYDIVYIDFDDFGAGDLLQNANRVQQVIEWVNMRKEEDGSEEENVLLGTSMGGVIGYRVLQQMEQAGIPAEAKYLITFDSPLRGANIPIGLQHLASTFADTRVSNSTTIGDKAQLLQASRAALESPAAKQLLVRNVFHSKNQNGQTESDVFYATLHSLPPPSSAELVYISSGSGIGAPQLLGPGGQFLKFDMFCSNNWGTFSIDYVEVYFESSTGNFPVYKQAFTKRLLGHFIIEFESFEYGINPATEYSSAPGGSSDFGTSMAFGSGAVTVDDCDALNVINFPTNGNFCFVPTYSGLNVPGVTNPMTFVAGACPSPAIGCSFSTDNSVWSHISGIQEHNQFHVSLNTRTTNFLIGYVKTGSDGCEINPIEDDIYNYGESDEQPIINPTAFGYYKTDNVIDFDLEIKPTGKLWVNRNGRVDFVSNTNNQQNQTSEHFELFIQSNDCDGSETLVSVESQADFHIGHWDDLINVTNNADVYVKENATIEIEKDGELYIEKFSNLIIDGGTVIVRNGGLLKAGWHGKIFVRNGGELIIEDNGRLRLTDNAQLIVEEHGKFTFLNKAKFQLWNSQVDADNPIRCNIWIKERGSFNYGGLPRITGLGYIQFDKWSEITAEHNVSEIKFVGQGKEHLLFQLNEGASLVLPDVDFKLQGVRVEYEQAAAITLDGDRKLTLFTSYLLGRTDVANFGFIGPKNNSVHIIDTDFENLATGLLTYEIERGTSYQISGSNFLNNRTGVWSIDDEACTFTACQFIGGKRGLLLEGTGVARFNANCIISGYHGDIDEVYNAEGGIVALLSNERATSINLDNSDVMGNGIGIFSPQGHKCSVGLFNDSKVDENFYGISMPGTIDGPDSSGKVSAVVTVDCSSISKNKIAGVHGSGIHLIIDASQPHIGSNTFERSDVGNGKLFDLWNTDVSYCMTGIAAHNNYWGPNDYCPVSPTDYIIKGSNLCNISLITECPEEISCEYGGTLPPCNDPVDGEGRSCPCDLPPTFPAFANMNEQWNAGVAAYRNGNMDKMEQLFSPLASVSNADREIGNGFCIALVDHARALAPFTIAPDTNNSISESSKSTSRSIDMDSNFKLFPNPFTEKLNLIMAGENLVKIYALDGKIIYQNTSDSSLSIDTKNWPSGTYLVKILNHQTQEIIDHKIIKI